MLFFIFMMLLKKRRSLKFFFFVMFFLFVMFRLFVMMFMLLWDEMVGAVLHFSVETGKKTHIYRIDYRIIYVINLHFYDILF